MTNDTTTDDPLVINEYSRLQLSSAMQDRVAAGGIDGDRVVACTVRAFQLIRQIGILRNSEKYERGARSPLKRMQQQLRDIRRANASDSLFDALKGMLAATPRYIDLEARAVAEFPNRKTLLHEAAINGLLDVVDLLIAAGADINAMSDHGTPFALTLREYIPVSDDLAKRGASITAPSEQEQADSPFQIDRRSIPIFIAAEANKPELIERMVAQGENCHRLTRLNDKNYSWIAPLYTTLFHNSMDALGALIACGAQPDFPGGEGFIPIVRAVEYHSSAEYCMALLNAGANLLDKDYEGQSALGAARQRTRDENKGWDVLELLQARHDRAHKLWQNAKQDGFDDGVSADDLILLANIGQFEPMMDQRYWAGHEDQARALMSHLPPWMSHIALDQQHWLASAPEPRIWNATLELPLRTREVAR